MTEISIVIPARNEAANIVTLLQGIDAACAALPAYEVIVIDDGSDDGTVEAVRARMAEHSHLRLIRHDRSGGQSAAVHSGVLAARGALIATLDGDGQNPPEELPHLLAPLLAPGAGPLGLVAGQRVGRQDTLSKRLASRFANALRARILHDGTRDTGCGLKAFRRDAFLRLPYFDHMHRYLPALFARDGWQIAHVDVSHRPRGGGRSNYSNLQRGLVGAVDLFGVAWLLRRRKKAAPQEMHRDEASK
ncbi:glycosyltransferase family 2 protein [Phaeovulum sp.]|uniref:glycosyltransferase family 2 protein n=1 Tax=Phaeovulum sp. TaxID=2934796 RepID=UPI0035638C30